MPYVVTENCIRCLYMDCVAVCPVDCFRLGDAMLVIHPEECIDCGVCEPACPVQAIRPDGDPEAGRWQAFNARFAEAWPRISEKRAPPADAEVWRERPGKEALILGADGP
ncbi:ferredoxin FdxA [Bosea sp. (in: a-proteobacteria)]|uniref:ferredoxin FdxA n=1 Tax=Bosea sp. (in: a-proteobacteria) TaxID=1871050 RepID=UPI003B3B7246